LNDNEAEVKHAAINNISNCLNSLSPEKITNLIMPTIITAMADGTMQFKSGSSRTLADIAQIVGKDIAVQKLIPVLMEMMKEDHSEIKMEVIQGL
jgi:serine/threonine-protein phosphatase 2A regulatory subunit A